MPWHPETELWGSHQTYQDHYSDVKEAIEDNAMQLDQHSNELAEAIECLVRNGTT